jgi:putative N6-adenine-specific DNA methylase
MSGHKYEMIAKTFYGLEEVLAEELRQLGSSNVKLLKRAVSFSGDKELMYRANYCLRTALKILVPVSVSEINDADDLYGFIRSIKWDQYFRLNDTFAVEAVLRTDVLKHSQFAAQKIKDAVVDQFRDKYGRRPSVDLNNPAFRISVHVSQHTAKLAVDSSGDPLYKRGYRQKQGPAPLNEVLAAGMIKLTGWKADRPFVDFMCGSGTLPIEASLIADKVSPGVLRQTYAFQNWKDFDAGMYKKVVRDNAPSNSTKTGIYASDIAPEAVRIARRHAQLAGVSECISFRTCNFIDMDSPGKEGIILLNPPYGERINQENLNGLYTSLGSKLKKSFTGFDAWILSANAEAIKHIGLRPTGKITLYNGQLECKFQHYSLYEGSKKTAKQFV